VADPLSNKTPAQQLRQQFLYANKFRTADFDIDLGGEEPLKVRVRAPSVNERNRIMAAAKDQSAKGISEAQALAVILCVRAQDGEGLIFGDEDMADLMNAPAGSWVDDLAGKVMQIINTGAEDAKKS
jgi:hypothetical protein